MGMISATNESISGITPESRMNIFPFSIHEDADLYSDILHKDSFLETVCCQAGTASVAVGLWTGRKDRKPNFNFPPLKSLYSPSPEVTVFGQ